MILKASVIAGLRGANRLSGFVVHRPAALAERALHL